MERNKAKNKIPKKIPEISKTGDIKTNDFNLIRAKKPALSTIHSQIKTAKMLIESGYTKPNRTEFDRLRMGINLCIYEDLIEFEDLYLEDVSNPKTPPSYIDNKNKKVELYDALKELDNINNKNKGVPFDVSINSETELNDILDEDYLDFEPSQTIITEDNSSPISSRKKRISYSDYSGTIGLTNLFIENGYFVVDITGKFMHGQGMLGYLHKDNIREALQKVIDLKVVSFNIDKFIKYAQVFVCDICVDLTLDSLEQAYKYIDGISSFFPISTNQFNIGKYGRHGLTLKPKSRNLGFFFVIYSKGQELISNHKKYNRAVKYIQGIGVEGEELARRTIRCEIKFYKLKNMRDWLKISSNAKCVVKLTDVLNSTQPVMLRAFELFSGKPEILLKHIEWLSDLETKEDGFTLSEIFLAERFVEILKDNSFDIEIAKNHIKTEYINVGTEEIKQFNTLANLRHNLLNFIVYRKPKSTTIMLAILGMLHTYYSTNLENSHAA